MFKFVLKRIISMIPVLLIVLVLVFALMRLIPGNPLYSIYADETLTKEDIIALGEEYGFNDPIWKQFINYFKNMLKGDWGTSYFDNQPVFKNIWAKWEPTIILTFYSSFLSLIIGVPIGIFAATHHNSFLDYLLSSISMIFMTIPAFCFGISLLYLFAFKIKIFPLSSYVSIAKGGFFKCLWSLTLPSLAVGLSGVAALARHTRSQMLDVLGTDYIRTARAKGLSERKVNYVHAFKNVMAVIITMVSNTLVANLGGSIVIERVFTIRGVGTLAYDSLTRFDYSQEQAILVFFAMIFIVMNIIVDIIYKLLDPRIELD